MTGWYYEQPGGGLEVPLGDTRPCHACGTQTGDPTDAVLPRLRDGRLVLTFACAAHVAEVLAWVDGQEWDDD